MPSKIFLSFMKKRLSFKIGIILAIGHLIYFVIFLREIIRHSDDGQWMFAWVSFWPIDFPISLLMVPALVLCPNVSFYFLPYPISELRYFILPSFIHGVLGTTWYFFLPIWIANLKQKIKIDGFAFASVICLFVGIICQLFKVIPLMDFALTEDMISFFPILFIFAVALAFLALVIISLKRGKLKDKLVAITSGGLSCILLLTLILQAKQPEVIPDVPTQNEIVMSEGMKITATTSVGTITITADKGLKRSYTWEGATRSVIMWPRSERWYGSLGIYYPGPGEHWKSHNGISRGVVDEGQQHFDTLEEVVAWLDLPYNSDYVYRDDGLVVGFSKNLNRKQINVDVWQIYIGGKIPSKYQESAGDRIWMFDPKDKPEIFKNSQNKTYYVGGEKPSQIPGSQNEKIKVEYLKDNSKH